MERVVITMLYIEQPNRYIALFMSATVISIE